MLDYGPHKSECLADDLHGVQSTDMRIRLTRKLALCLNGVDISDLRVGEEVDLPERSARVLIADGWAEPVYDSPPPLRPKSTRLATN